MTKVAAVRSYEVRVDGYAPILYCARSASRARWAAYRAYAEIYDSTFTRFLAISSVRRVETRPESAK